jgi:hypothetical protein
LESDLKRLWLLLTTWLVFGLVLEFLLAIKANSYLGEDIRREMWRLAHAHGVLLSAITLLCDAQLGWGGKLAKPMMIFGAIAMPLGFFLGGCWPSLTDPNELVILAPVGGLTFVVGLGLNLTYKLGKNGDREGGR